MQGLLTRTAIVTVMASVVAGGCSAEGTPNTAALPADQMVFVMDSYGGMTPRVIAALQSPSLVLYGDGRVLTAEMTEIAAAVPTRYEIARATPDAVRRFVDSAQSGGLISDRTDFGSPRVTDLETTTVVVHGDGGRSEVAVYALHEAVEAGLSTDQRRAREDLRALIGQARALADDAPRTAYVPDRVVVYEVDADSSGESATVGWPGPPPASFLTARGQREAIACGELNADPAEQVYRAALDNPGARWPVDGVTRVLAVNPLPLPGDCG